MIEERTLYSRRTGAAVLGLLAATNLIPWMGLLAGRVAASEVVALSEVAAAFGACVFSAVLLLVSWLFGRHRGATAGTRIVRPRLLGLRLAILAAALNLVLAGVVLTLRSGPFSGFSVGLSVFGLVWLLLILPVEVLAAYCKGHASAPLRAAAPEAAVARTGM